MSTRSLTHIKEYDGKTILTIYRQGDGYPEGHGLDLARILARGGVVNGYSRRPGEAFNGMGCLAAAVIASLKEGIGNIYVFPADSEDCGEEFVYEVTCNEPKGFPQSIETPTITLREPGGPPLFQGTPEEFLYRYEPKD